MRGWTAFLMPASLAAGGLAGCHPAAVPAGPVPASASARPAIVPVTLTVGTFKGTNKGIHLGPPPPCRVHLKNAAGEPQRAEGLPFWKDHFVCPGAARLDLPPGEYTYEIERGPEYERASGFFTVKAGDGALELYVHSGGAVGSFPRDEGWWPGDLHVHRPIEDMELLMEAEDLYVAPVITWRHNRNAWARRGPPADPLLRFPVPDPDRPRSRFAHVLAGEDEREGGTVLYFNVSKPLVFGTVGKEYPSPMAFMAEARRDPGAWIDVEKPYWWDVPVWLAGGQVDSIGLAHNAMLRGDVYPTEAWGKPRDDKRLPLPYGNGLWTQEIYYHILNCGLRIPPSAGSASGVMANPVGHNRVYAHVEGELTHEKWWESLRAGRVFVTNGPLLRVRANGELPGHVFTAAEGEELAIEIKAVLSSREPVHSVELIRDGRIERSEPVARTAAPQSLGVLRFRSSGWFLVRAISPDEKTFRFASTGPFYVEIGKTKRRVSRASARFFLDWVRERMGRIREEDPGKRGEVLRYHREAERFWEAKVEQADAE